MRQYFLINPQPPSQLVSLVTGPMKHSDCIFYLKTLVQGKPIFLYNTSKRNIETNQDNSSSRQVIHTKKSKGNKYDGNVITFCSTKELQDTVSIETIDATSLSSSLSVFSNVKAVHQLFQKTAVYVREKKKVNRVLTEEIEFPPKCLLKVKELLIESTIATHNVGTGENLEEARRALTMEPVGCIVDGSPMKEVQDDMQTSHMIDIAMQIVCFPQVRMTILSATTTLALTQQILAPRSSQLFGITLDEINTPPYSQIKHLIHLTYAFILNCLDNPKVKDYICAGYVCTCEDIGTNKLYNNQDNFLETLSKGSTDQWVANLKDVSAKKIGTSWIDMMISHLGYELGVGEVLSQLFLDNDHLLQNGVTTKSIETFIRLIKVKGPQSRFLNFLKVLARCSQIDGSRTGITQNQELLMNTVFKNESHAYVVMETVLDLDANHNESERPNRQYFKISELLNPSKVWDVDVGRDVMGAALTAKNAAFKDIAVSWASCAFWFPGMGSEFALFHSPKSLGINNKDSLNSSVISLPGHVSRNNHADPSKISNYNSDKPFGFDDDHLSKESKRVIATLQELIRQVAKGNQGVYPNFEPSFLKVMQVAERSQLASKVRMDKTEQERAPCLSTYATHSRLHHSSQEMTFSDFLSILSIFKITDDLLHDSTEIFFRECCLRQTKPFPDDSPIGNALEVFHHLMKAISQPTNDLAWVRLEELVWVLDHNFRSPVSTWRTTFHKLLIEDPKPPNFDVQMENLLSNRKNFDTIYHKVHCQDINCNGTKEGGGYCRFFKHKEFAPWASPEIGGKKSKEQFKQMKRLANFYNEKLQLVAESCADRSNNCIRHFQVQYSFEMVFTGVTNESLPPEIRSSFTKLMIALYIDRYPHERVLSNSNNMYLEDEITRIIHASGKIPLQAFVSTRTEADIERIDDHIQSIQPPEEKNKVRDFFNKKSADKFLLLRDYIANFLILNRFIPLGGRNKTFLNLQSSILDLVYELLDYGFYGSMASLRKILKPLLIILDSRNQLQDEDIDSDDDSGILEEDEEEQASIRSIRGTRGGKKSKGKDRSSSFDWLDNDDDNNDSNGAHVRGSTRRKSTFSLRRSSIATRSFREMTKAATAAAGEASQNGDSVVTLDLQPTSAILPKYTLSNSNSRVHLMRKKICKIVYLMCSRNTEIMMKQLLVQLQENKDDINLVAKSVMKRRRMSADHSSFLDTSNLEKFNARYKNIYQDTEAESSAVNNLRARFFNNGKIAPMLSEKETTSNSNSAEGSFSSMANTAKNQMLQNASVIEDEDQFMLSLFYTVSLMRDNSSKTETQFIDLEAIITDDTSPNSVDEMLIDLMMHEMPDLFESALMLLTQRYYMKRTLYQNLQNAVVVGQEEDESNEFFRRHLRQLRNDATSFELWKSNAKVQHSTAYIRSIKTLGVLSRLTGLFGQRYMKKYSVGSAGGGAAKPTKTSSPLLKGSTLERVRNDVDIFDIEAREDSLPLVNDVLFGMDSSTRNVSIYLHAILSSCKDYLNARTAPAVINPDFMRLPVVLGVFESGYNQIEPANNKRYTGAIHTNLMTINQAVRVCLRVLAIPFDELSAEGNICPSCGEALPRSHIAVSMENSDFESVTFECYCPKKACLGKPKMLLKKMQRELFSLKRKCMSTLQHMALTNLEAREELTEKLPEIEKHILGGLGAEKCFFAISSSSEYYSKVMTESHIDAMISVIERSYGSDRRAFDVSSLKMIDTEPLLVALRYLRLVAMNDAVTRVGILRKLCERTSLVSTEFFCSASSAFKLARERVSDLEDEENLTVKETYEIVESLQLYTITLNLIGELAASKDTEIEGILQTVLPLRHIIDLLCREEAEKKLPMIYGVKAAISKCLICFWFNTSIGVPNMIKFPQLPWLVQRLRKDLENFMETLEKEKDEPASSDQEETEQEQRAATAGTNPEERVLLEHHKVHKSLAQRIWIYNGVIPILVAFFDDNGPWDASEAPDSLAIAESKLANTIEQFIKLEKKNYDHTSDLKKLSKVFNSNTEGELSGIYSKPSRKPLLTQLPFNLPQSPKWPTGACSLGVESVGKLPS